MRYLVLGLLCLIAMIGYVQRVGINSAYRPIQEQFSIDTQQFGSLGSMFLLGYAIMQLPSGWLADIWGSRSTLVLYALLWSGITAVIGWMPDFASVTFLWFAMGMAQAGIFPCAAKAIGAWVPDTQKAMASGFVASSQMLGTAAASTVSAPAGFTERFDAFATAGTYRTTSELSDRLQASQGSSGILTATASATAVSVGQTVALKPA